MLRKARYLVTEAASSPAIHHDNGLVRQLLEQQISVRVRVTGQSMKPFLLDNDIVTIEPNSRARPGDVIVLKTSDGHLIMHRLLWSNLRSGKAFVRCKGDAIRDVDFAAPASSVLGRVVNRYRGGVDLDMNNMRWTLLRRAMWTYHIGKWIFTKLGGENGIRT